MDSEFGSIDMSDARSFSWAIDFAIRTPSKNLNFGASPSPAHSFASVVDRAIRSRTPSIFGALPSPVHSFASALHTRVTFSELVEATNSFSLDNEIGAGRFGVVYRGKLVDGREIAVKRNETSSKTNFEYDFLSRLRHQNLVGLVGECQEIDERLLVYEYMNNGTLYDHLHYKSSSELSSWKLRIKFALDACRGIEFLHSYAIPSIIHGNIKSSNILLDATQTARISDFELSFMSQEVDTDWHDKVVGSVGYIDPEYLRRGVVTEKSDVYGVGVVLLEILTGKRAIFMSGEDGCSPLSVVDLAVPVILGGYLLKILDPKVAPPDVNEAEALQLVAYTAIHRVNLKGRNRPTMTHIVHNLERALDICYSSPYDSIFSTIVRNR